MPLDGYLQLLRPGGYLIFVGVPEAGIPKIHPFKLIMNVTTEGLLLLMLYELTAWFPGHPHGRECDWLARRNR